MKLLADCKLYAFVDTAYLHGRAPELVAQQLCDGGADLIQGNGVRAAFSFYCHPGLRKKPKRMGHPT